MTQPQLETWFIPLDAGNSHALPAEAQLLACLSEQELARQQGFTHSRAAYTNLISRGMLRHILSLYVSVPPAKWRFMLGEQGKPELIPEQREAYQLAFNVSHSGNWLCIAVLCGAESQQHIGVDIERFRPGVSTDSVLGRFFAPREIISLQALEPALRQQRFFDLWALKESFIKAIGLGLACPLDSFAFDINELANGPGQCLISSAKPDLHSAGEGVAWSFVALSGSHTQGLSSRFARLTDEYRVALTCSSSLDALPVVCRFWKSEFFHR